MTLFVRFFCCGLFPRSKKRKQEESHRAFPAEVRDFLLLDYFLLSRLSGKTIPDNLALTLYVCLICKTKKKRFTVLETDLVN